MKRKSIFLLILAFLIINNTCNANSIDSKQKYLLEFSAPLTPSVSEILSGKIIKSYDELNIISANLTLEDVSTLKKQKGILYVEKDYEAKINSQDSNLTINHTKLPVMTNDNSYTGSEVNIGILDTGISPFHKDLNIAGGVNLINNNGNYYDDNGHGTLVSGIISALDNNIGIKGIAPNANLYSIKVLDASGNGSYSNIIEGIQWAIEKNLDIINLSLGGSEPSNALKKAVKEAYKRGLLIISSTGNDGYDDKGNVTYPSAYKSVLAVGAVNQNNILAEFSNTGKEVELVAPGVSITSTNIAGTYETVSGTSFSAPFVTGISALYMEKNKDFTNEEIRSLLHTNAIPLGHKYLYGYGLVSY